MNFKEQFEMEQIKKEKIEELDSAIEQALEKAYETFGSPSNIDEDFTSRLRDLLEDLREFSEQL